MAQQTPFISMDIMQEDNVDPDYNMFGAFRWLNYMVAYNVMWAFKTPQQTKRNIACNFIGLVLLLSSLSYNIVQWIYYQYTSNLISGSVTTPLFLIINFMAMSFIYASKLLSLKYYYKVFKYPWSIRMDRSNDAKHVQLCKNKIKNTNKRMIIFLFTFFTMGIVHYAAELLAAPPTISDYAWIFTFFYVIAIPVAVSQCCSSVIFLQYELSIIRLMNNLSSENSTNSSDIDYLAITTEYKKLMFSFNKESQFWTWYFGLKFLGFFCLVWLYSSELIHYVQSTEDTIFCFIGISFWMAPFCELVFASSHLSSAYHAFVEKLLYAQTNHLSRMSKTNDFKEAFQACKSSQECAYLYNYALSNKLSFRLFGSELNFQTAIRLVLFFCGAKFMSYAIYNV